MCANQNVHSHRSACGHERTHCVLYYSVFVMYRCVIFACTHVFGYDCVPGESRLRFHHPLKDALVLHVICVHDARKGTALARVVHRNGGIFTRTATLIVFAQQPFGR